MPAYAFPFTAPQQTDEELRAEKASLTDEEKARYNAEMYGKETQVNETEEVIQQGLELMLAALDVIPPTEKVEYTEAMSRVPELVECESPHLSFLRAVQYDSWAAARRLVDYWAVRKKVFGKDKAYLPITLQGAMVDDVQFLEKAVIFALPSDEHQRGTLFIDRIRCTDDVIPRDSACRCFWYVIQGMAEEEAYQHRGFILLSNNRGFNLYKHFDRILAKTMLLILNSMPIRVRAFHSCTGPGPSVSRDVVYPLLRAMATKDFRMRYRIHSGHRPELLRLLQDFGLGEVHVQALFGGESGNKDAAKAWLAHRRGIEQSHKP